MSEPIASPAAPLSPASSSNAIRRSLARITVEILVGFIGVYAAFALTAYKERRDLIDRRHQIKRALVAEVKEIADHQRRDAPVYVKVLARFDSSVAAGRPLVHSFSEAVDQQGHVWEATKASGALNLIDVPTFILLSKFYNDNSNLYAQYGQLRDISMQEIVPRAYGDPSAYLDPASKRVIPPLLIYRSGLRRIAGFSKSLSVEGDSIVRILARDTI